MRFNKSILLILILVHSQLFSQTYSASNFTLVGQLNPETTANTQGNKYSSCWGWYQASKNKEYAIACSHRGIYWVDVTNPATPTVSAYSVGSRSLCVWREAKTYRNYCYVISDDSPPNGFQIYDMQYLPDSVHLVHNGKSIFERGHTLWVDSNKLIVSSVTYSDNTHHNMNLYSLANPASPALLRSLDQDYSFINLAHDTYMRRDTLFVSAGYSGMYVFTYNNTGNVFNQIGSLTGYPGAGYNHSSALTPNSKTMVMLDEVPQGLPVKVVDVTNISNIQVLDTISQFNQTTPHNPFIVNNQYCFIAAYQDGLQLFDISNPSSPFLAGYFDTYPQGGGNTGTWVSGWEGLWGCYPFFPSKNIFALDQKNGVFMLKTHLYANPPVNPVGFGENVSKEVIRLCPNPTSELIRFDIPVSLLKKPLEVKIYDENGRLSLDLNNESLLRINVYQAGINVKDLGEGIYFLRLLSGSELISTSKFVIWR